MPCFVFSFWHLKIYCTLVPRVKNLDSSIMEGQRLIIYGGTSITLWR